jgi:hypothetical protein
MKKLVYIAIVGILGGACSSHKYTASFPNYDKTQSVASSKVVAPEKVQVDPQLLVASTSAAVVISDVKSAPAEKVSIQMTKAQRKEVKAEIKREVKSFVKAKKSMGVTAVSATQAMDKDLKLGLIFILAGVIGYWIAWPVGAILTIIGLVFLIKWLIRQ